MDSIVKTSGRRKCIVVKRERSYRMVKGDLGTQVKREPLHIWRHKHKPPVRKQGDISGFSENSRSRLRVLLSTAKWKGKSKCIRCGFTLTLPWAASPDEWRKVWAAFVKRLINKFSDVGMIWRIELTTGKAKTSGGLRRTHIHAIFWVPVDSLLGCKDVGGLFGHTDEIRRARWAYNVHALAGAWCAAWAYYAPELEERQVRYACSVGDSKGCGIVVKALDDSTDGAIHYLCDHASKHKKEQLGWKGRQWGVVNRRCFSFPSEDDGEHLTGAEWALASRSLRRYSRKLRRSGSKRAQPYGDNKCFFGLSEKILYDVIKAVKDGRISCVQRAERL